MFNDSKIESLNDQTSGNLCDINDSKPEYNEKHEQPVFVSSILKSALIGARTYEYKPTKPDENLILADTTVTDEQVITDQISSGMLNNEINSKIRKEDVDLIIRQLIGVDDYSNCGRFFRPELDQSSSSANQERKLIRYVQKNNANDSEDLSEKTIDETEKTDLVSKSSMDTILEDLIQDNENNKESKANSNDEDKDIEMLGIINDKKLGLNQKLCLIGDSIVFRLVEWTKKLPFYSKLPVYSITMVIDFINFNI